MLPTVLRTLLLLISTQLFAADYDVVIANGRVIDPETNLDGIRHVGIRSGAISTISEQPLVGTKTIDAKGLVVAPGFIDVHSHTPTLLGQHVNLLDGITTQLDLEAGCEKTSPNATYCFQLEIEFSGDRSRGHCHHLERCRW